MGLPHSDTAARLTRKGFQAMNAGPAGDVLEGRCTLVELSGTEIGLFRVDGTVYAIRNYCPHRGAPICRGQVGGTMLPSAPGEYEFGLEGRVLHCPWHHWEYDITTGRSLFNLDRSRLITYQVDTYEVEELGEEIFVWMKPQRGSAHRGAAPSPA